MAEFSARVRHRLESDMYGRTCDSCATMKEEITYKFRFEDPKFDGYTDPRVFSDWLADMECYFDCHEMSNVHKIRLARMRTVGPAKTYWTSIEITRERQHKNPIESGEEMKDKFKEKYLLSLIGTAS